MGLELVTIISDLQRFTTRASLTDTLKCWFSNFLPNGLKDEDSSDDVIAASPSLSEVFHEYVEHASIQGLNYWFLFTTSPFGKVFWCITVMAAVSQGFYWCDVTYQLWSTKPVITTIGSTSLPVQEARIFFS